MDPKREEFNKYAMEFMYDVSDGNNYADIQIHGLYNKLGLRGTIRCYKAACKRDKNLTDLFDIAYEYTKINPQDRYSYSKESALIDTIDKYAEIALETTKASLDSISDIIEQKQKTKENLSDDEQKKIDFECLVLREDTENCYLAAVAVKFSFDMMIFGLLPSEEIPADYFANTDSGQPVGHPLFSHIPMGTDLSDEIRSKSPFFIGLSNYAKYTPHNLISVFSDCGNGTVCIKLWDIDTQQPVYVGVDKNEVYNEWIRDEGRIALWPGLLCKALETRGYSVYTDDPEKLFKIVFGPDTNVDSEYLSFFAPGTIENTPDIYAYEQYFRCLQDISRSLLSTQNINVKDVEPFLALREAVKIVEGTVFDNFSSNIDLLGPAMDYLKQVSDEYRAVRDPSRKHSRRLEICDSIDQLYTIFKNNYLKYTPIDVFEPPTGHSLNRD